MLEHWMIIGYFALGMIVTGVSLGFTYYEDKKQKRDPVDGLFFAAILVIVLWPVILAAMITYGIAKATDKDVKK